MRAPEAGPFEIRGHEVAQNSSAGPVPANGATPHRHPPPRGRLNRVALRSSRLALPNVDRFTADHVGSPLASRHRRSGMTHKREEITMRIVLGVALCAIAASVGVQQAAARGVLGVSATDLPPNVPVRGAWVRQGARLCRNGGGAAAERRHRCGGWPTDQRRVFAHRRHRCLQRRRPSDAGRNTAERKRHPASDLDRFAW
jgi:hypothetical protein